MQPSGPQSWAVDDVRRLLAVVNQLHTAPGRDRHRELAGQLLSVLNADVAAVFAGEAGGHFVRLELRSAVAPTAESKAFAAVESMGSGSDLANDEQGGLGESAFSSGSSWGDDPDEPELNEAVSRTDESLAVEEDASAEAGDTVADGLSADVPYAASGDYGVDLAVDAPAGVTLIPAGENGLASLRSVWRDGDRPTVLVVWRSRPFTERHALLMSLLHPAAAWVFRPLATRENLPAGTEAVLELMLRGLREKEIARRLGRSAHTVHSHVKRVYKYYEVSSRAELMVQLNNKR